MWGDWKPVKHRLGFGLNGGIKTIKIRLYGGDKAGNYFLFISILNFRKSIFKLLEKYKKYDGNDMVVDMAQREHSDIKCYASAFSNTSRRPARCAW